MQRKTPTEIQAMRPAGIVVARILAATKALAAPGVTGLDLDEAARGILAEAGAGAPFLNYVPHPSMPPFPGVICVSVNDAALHGIPDDTPLSDGDLVSIDCGAEVDGWVGDAAVSFVVGRADPADLALIDCAERALAAGIAAAVPGNQLGDISAAIGHVGRAGGYGINTDFGGHGVGHSMHESPSVPNEGRAHRGPTLRSGLVIAIEPWFMTGTDHYRVDDDGWTLRNGDGGRSVHVEHTVAITADGPVVLTAPEE